MITVKHAKHSNKVDATDSTLVRPSDWNAGHNFSSDENGFVLGRDTSGSGDIQELPLEIKPDGSVIVTGTGTFNPPAGDNASRPAGTPGALRYNTETHQLEVWNLGGIAGWQPLDPNDFLKAGFVSMFAGAAVPVGWARCDGHLESRTGQAALFAAIGIRWGAGDGSTTFNVPDFQDVVLVGVGSLYDLAERRGALTAAVPLPAHNHVFSDDLGTDHANIPFPVVINLGGTGVGSQLWQNLPPPPSLPLTVSIKSAGVASPTVPLEQPGVGVNVFIKL